MKRILPVILIAAVLLSALIYSRVQRGPLVISGIIEADEARLASRVGGRVLRAEVDDGARVEVGQELVRLDPFTLTAERAQAEATLAQRKAELEQLEHGSRPEEIAGAEAAAAAARARHQEAKAGPRAEEIGAAEANRDLARAQVELTRLTEARTRSLRESRAVSAQELDKATQEFQVACATLRAREQELTQLQKGTRAEQIERARAEAAQAEQAAELARKGPRVEEIARAKGAVDAARAAVDAYDARLAEMVIRATIKGQVETVDLQPGDVLSPNQPALTVIDPDRLWVRAYVPEWSLDVRVGREVPVAVDAFPGERFKGRISFISRQGEFTPRNLQTSEKRVEQVFEIRVDLLEGIDRLRAGMAADVTLSPHGAPAAGEGAP